MELYERIRSRLGELEERGRLRRLPEAGRRSGSSIAFGERELVNLSSNDYLGLSDDRELLDAFMRAQEPDWLALGSSSSRLLTGNSPLCEQLESDLAGLYGRQAALVFNSGYHANIGILPALAGRHDLVLSDRLNHASIIDGLKMGEAPWQRYRHNDYDHLAELLHAASGRSRQLFIVTESLFSMDGDLCDLARLVELKRRYGALLVLDEAHAVGTFGARGLGLAEARGLQGEVDIIIGTFGKSFASSGAYAVMDSLLCRYLVNTMRSFIFTTALSPMAVGWSRHVLHRQLDMEPERRHLAGLSARLRRALVDKGLAVPGESHIVPVVAGSDRRAVAMAAKLRDAGFLALPVRPPTVPENGSRVRISLRSILEWEQLAPLVEVFGEEAA